MRQRRWACSIAYNPKHKGSRRISKKKATKICRAPLKKKKPVR